MDKDIKFRKYAKLFGGKGIDKLLSNPQAYLIREGDYVFFDKVYNKLKKQLDYLQINELKFFDEIYESFSRYKRYKNIDVMTPMTDKARKYIKDYLEETIPDVYNKVYQEKAF